MSVTDMYIHATKTGWIRNTSARSSLMRGMSSAIPLAYAENSRRLRSGIDLTDKEIKDFKDIMEFRSEAAKHTPGQEALGEFFEYIAKYVADLSKYVVVDGITLGQIGNSQQHLTKGADQLIKAVNALNGILDDVDKHFEALSIFDPYFNPQDPDAVYGISRQELSGAKTARDNIRERLKKFSGDANIKSLEKEIKKELTSSAGTILKGIKGALFEYADYIRSLALKEGINEIAKEVELLGAKMTGQSNVKETNSSKSFSAKSDTVHIITVPNKKGGGRIEIQVGISDKSYAKGDASSKPLAKKTSWKAIMANLVPETSGFENFYANVMIHEPELAMTPSAPMNKYLAALASGFAISGRPSQGVPNAYFMRYADEMIFIPKLLEQLSKKGANSQGLFKVEVSSGGSKISEKIDEFQSVAKKKIKGEDTDALAIQRSSFVAAMMISRIKFTVTR